MQCIISRLGEPNIARLYPVEPDQNLVNNIRVLCTKYNEDFRYFVPEEKFGDIRNGYTLPMRAACCDGSGEWLLEIDPLKVLSEQLEEAGYRRPYKGRLEIRIGVEGYELPAPGDEPGFLDRPAGYTGMKERTQHRKVRSSRRSAAKFMRSAVVTVLVIAVLAAAFLLFRDTSVSQFEKEMDAANYATAVSIYNEKISGSATRQAKADPMAKSEVEAIEEGYLSGAIAYEDACAYLGILTGISNGEISGLAQSAKDEVELYESASVSYKDGLALLEEKKYVAAIGKFLEIPESAERYSDAQDQIDTCVDCLVRSAGKIRDADQYGEALAGIDAALELLPGNSDLTEGRETCQKKYENLVRNSAVSEADALAASGDYAGAFARIREAEELLPEDERLTGKYDEYHRAYVAQITKETAAKVDGGDFEGAYSLLGEASGIHECEEFDSLYGQLEEAEDRGSGTDASVCDAQKVNFLTLKGKIKTEGKPVKHAIKASESGVYRFIFTSVTKKSKVKIVITSSEGEELASEIGLVKGGAVNCRLEKGKSYTAEVFGDEGKGSYVLKVGQPKPEADISSYDVVNDYMEYAKQVNLYRFVPDNTGIYRFDLQNTADGRKVKFNITDSMDYPVTSSATLSDGVGVTVELHEGEEYEIRCEQAAKLGAYTLRIGKQAPAQEATGMTVLSGNISFTGQKTVYTYTAAEAGMYVFTLGNMPDGLSVKLFVYDSLGYKLGGEEEIGSGGSVTAEFEAGKVYQFHLIQVYGDGGYTLTVIKE